MRKKFTMLLASLFLVMGTAKADFTQEWRQNTVWQTTGFTAPDGVTAVAGGFSVAFMEIPVRVTSTTIGLTFDWGNIGNCALQVLGVDLVNEAGEVQKAHYGHQAAGGSSDGVYSLTELTAETEGKLRYFVGYGSGDRLNDTGGTITVTGADRSNLVTLTISYSYDGNAVSSTDVRVPSGEQYAIPALTYTKIASAIMNDAEQTVTNGACTITVPAEATTISVVLANNLPFEVSASYNNAIWYTLQIRTNKYMRKNGDGISVAVETPTTEDALWAFMGDPFNGITVLNKAAGEGYVLANDNGIKMKQGSATWGIYPGNGGFMLREGTEGNNYIHNLSNGSGVGYWNSNSTTTDNGSAFVVKSEAEMISLATAALNSTNTTINSYKNIEATYYLPLQASVDAAKTLLEGKTATDMMSALQLKSATEAAAALLVGNSDDEPKAGDVVSLKNRQYNDYLSVDDSNDLCGGAKGTYWTLKAIEGVDDYYYLYNEEKQVYAKPLADSDNAKTSVTANEAEAGKYGFKQVGTTSYAALHDNHLGANVGDKSYLHHSNWSDKKMVRWNMELGTEASHWLVSQVYPLTVVYNFKGNELEEQKVTTNVVGGDTYTITNPYANKYVNVTCAVNGSRIEAVDGQWPVKVTGPTSVIVTITEDLPFKTSTDFNTANWQYLQVNSGSWKFVQKNEGDNNTSSANANSLNDRALWAFVGDAINGFKILNKGAEGAVLTVDATDDATVAYMKASGDQTWTIEKGNGGFVIRQGAQECLNDYAGGGVIKIYNHSNSPTGSGSAFRTISGGVTDITKLALPGIFTLQAERSPLLYDANADNPNKLSSGMVSNIPANAKDANQQFMFVNSDTDGMYYLYNVGAAKFVDANLNFTDYPEPVLSFEVNDANPVFPWFVKINGKYVVPGNGGEDGNKIFHTSTPADDNGKRYRIEHVDDDLSLATSVAMIVQSAVGLVKNANMLSNDMVYAVYTFDRGAWYHNGDDALWSTGKTAKPADASEDADKFAFLTVNGKVYLYSVGAGKFVVRSETKGSSAHENRYYATYSDQPTQSIELLPATNGGWFPVVVKFNVDGDNQLCVSNNFSYPVIMYNNQGDPGNKVRIEAVSGGYNFDDVLNDIEDYQMQAEAVGGLADLIAEATAKNAPLGIESLTDAIAAAQSAYNDRENATYNDLITAKEALATALNSALYVTEINGFSNNYVYTFVSKRGWMGADNTDGVISGTGADDNANYQWAVYKSTREHYYLYNIGKGQFMGVEIRNNTQMPFSATPQTTGLTFKKSAWADYPIMFSMDNQYVVNNDNNGKMICWTGGWSKLDDEGSNHKVTIVGKIESSTLTTIAAAVELYETQGVAVQALDAAIAAAQAKVDGIGAGLGYYSTTEADAAATLAAIVEFKKAITGETTVAAIEDQTAAANALVETFSVNLPKPGKFYRFSYDYGTAAGVKYVQAVASNASGKGNGMLMSEEQSVASIFYYDGGEDAESIEDDKLLSYSTGLYVRETGGTRGLQTVGATAGKAKFTAGSKAGKLYIYADDSFHANIDGTIYFIDHCADGHPDQAEDKHNFTVEEVTTLPVTVSAAQVTFNEEQKYVSTLFTPVALRIPEGITAYIGVNEDNYLAMEPVEDIIPANTGVILMADEAKIHEFAISAEAGTAIEAEDNIITGTVAKTVITPDANTTCYVLANGEDGIGLYKAKLNKNASGATGTTSFLNNACKAYIPVSVAEPQAAQALAFRFRGKGQGTTEIEMPMANGQQPAAIYDLTGRRIEKIVEKGIYIVNGKKVVIK